MGMGIAHMKQHDDYLDEWLAPDGDPDALAVAGFIREHDRPSPTEWKPQHPVLRVVMLVVGALGWAASLFGTFVVPFM